MIHVEPDDALERELFAMRAVEPMHLDVRDVLARAESLAPPHTKTSHTKTPWMVWAAAAICFFGATRMPMHPAQQSRGETLVSSGDFSTGFSDGLTCRADANSNVNEPSSSFDGAMCFAAPSSLVCDGRDENVTSSIGTP